MVAPSIFEEFLDEIITSILSLFLLPLYIVLISNDYVLGKNSKDLKNIHNLKFIKCYLYIISLSLCSLEIVSISYLFYSLNFWISLIIISVMAFINNVIFRYTCNQSKNFQTIADIISADIKGTEYNLSIKIFKFIPKLIILFIFKITGSKEFVLKKILLLEFNLNYFDNELFESELLSKHTVWEILNSRWIK